LDEMPGSGFVFFNKTNGVADSQDGVGGGIRDFDPEFLFNFHHDLDGLEGICTKIVCEVGVIDDCGGVRTKLMDDDVSDTFCNGGHGNTPQDLSAGHPDPGEIALNFQDKTKTDFAGTGSRVTWSKDDDIGAYLAFRNRERAGGPTS